MWVFAAVEVRDGRREAGKYGSENLVCRPVKGV